MRRQILSHSSLIPDASSVKESHIRIQPVVMYSHNMMPMHAHVCPHHPATSIINELTSVETVLQILWENQMEQLKNSIGFDRLSNLPLSRVRKIMKSDPEVKMISSDTPALFSKACEYFILELTLRAWMHTQSCRRQTIRRCDLFHALKKSETYGFLLNLVPFGPHCAIHQGVPPPPVIILPDMNVPLLDMNQIDEEKKKLVSKPCINNIRGFDLNANLQDCTCGVGFCHEHDSAESS